MANGDILRIGCAAGFSGDRTDAALPVVQALIGGGGPAVLIFETLAERTLALAQLARRTDPQAGFEPLLDELLRPVLALCLEHGIRIVSNFGAANPEGAARRIHQLATELGLRCPRVAVVHGDDLSGPGHQPLLSGALGSALPARAGGERQCLHRRGSRSPGRCGRVRTSSCAGGWPIPPSSSGPLWRISAGGWTTGTAWPAPPWPGICWNAARRSPADISPIQATRTCPAWRNWAIPSPRSMPTATAPLSKPEGTGGRIDERTVKEQLLYELHDPAAYLTPDVVADITAATVREIAPGRVRLEGVRGHQRPAALKVNVCFEAGWFAEGEISYAGPRAEARARLAGETLRERLAGVAPLRLDLIGVTSVFGDDASRWLDQEPPGNARDVRLRAALQHRDPAAARRLVREVTALYCCGPAGGGGVRTAMRPRLGMVSCLVPREAVPTGHRFLD